MVALPYYDSDDEFGPNKTFPQLAPENIMGGMISSYFNPVGPDGLTYVEREQSALRARMDKEEDELMKKFEEQMDDTERNLRQELGMIQPPKKTSRSASPVRRLATKPNPSKPGTVSAKSAATALGRPVSKPSSFASATASSSSKTPSSVLNVRKSRAVSAADSSASRYAAATAASKSTLGYSQGRAASHQIRKTSTIYRDRAASSSAPLDKDNSTTSGEHDAFDSETADVIEQLRIQELAFVAMDDDEIDFGLDPVEDHGHDIFQLDVPQL
jgi:hypothetical protein